MNKINFSLFLLLILFSCKNQQAENNPSETYEVILNRIQIPVFPDTIYNISDYGAKGDSATDCKPAFEAAMNACKSSNGGKIVVPKGIYLLKGPIHFVSNTNLHLEEGAILKFDSEAKNYLPVVQTSWEGTFLYNYSPFIYAYQCENIAITGKGIIDGEASNSWSLWAGKQKEDQLLSRQMNHDSIPVEKRIFGEGHFLRPQLIQFYDCKNILIEGVKVEDSPFWCIHLLQCKNATIRGISYDAQNKNNDGIDPEYSEDILIENITFNNADDNVAVKAGRDYEGRSMKSGSRNIIIRNCKFKGLHALVIGSEMSAGVEKIYVRNCSYAGTLKRGIYLKSNPDRGGYIRNIFIDNVEFDTVEDCIFITSFYHGEGSGFATDIHNVRINNLSCKKATANGIVIQGFPDKKVKDIYFSNVKIDSVTSAISLTNAENIIMNEVIIGNEVGIPSWAK